MEDNTFIRESVSPDGNWAVVFEDDGETGYMYLGMLRDGEVKGITDALWIYDKLEPPISESDEVNIGWVPGTSRAGLIVDGDCWGILDIGNQRKMNAPREGNTILPIQDHYSENGLGPTDGEELRLFLD